MKIKIKGFPCAAWRKDCTQRVANDCKAFFQIEEEAIKNFWKNKLRN